MKKEDEKLEIWLSCVRFQMFGNFLPDSEEGIDQKRRIGDPLEANLLRQVEHYAGIAGRVKAKPKHVKR